jgi:hypothetical protein
MIKKTMDRARDFSFFGRKPWTRIDDSRWVLYSAGVFFAPWWEVFKTFLNRRYLDMHVEADRAMNFPDEEIKDHQRTREVGLALVFAATALVPMILFGYMLSTTEIHWITAAVLALLVALPSNILMHALFNATFMLFGKAPLMIAGTAAARRSARDAK